MGYGQVFRVSAEALGATMVETFVTLRILGMLACCLGGRVCWEEKQQCHSGEAEVVLHHS